MENEGRYLYCVFSGNSNKNFGDMGIDDSSVYTIIYKDIGAVVHKCLPMAYDSKDEKKVKEWILSHHYIVDEAGKSFNAVIPFSFDTIIKGSDDVVKEWLREEYITIKNKLSSLREKAEYTIQIFCDRDIIIRKNIQKNKKIKEMETEIKKKPRGIAYMLGQKMELMVKNEFDTLTDKYIKEFYEEINKYVDDIKIESKNKIVPEKWRDMYMLLNISCLVHYDKVKSIGKILGKINKKEGFSVRFTGPWAPYSFVGEIGGRK